MFLKKNKRNIVVFIVFVLTLCLLSFALGVYSLRNGTLRKAYDIIFALKNTGFNNTHNKYHSSLPKIDTLDLRLSKKKEKEIINLRSDKINSLENITTYGVQWVGERPWFSAKLIKNYKNILTGKIKLMGINPDHFREDDNWSLRVKLKADEYFNGYQKFNLLVPYSRGYFIDAFYNTIYKQEGGMSITTKPIITKLFNGYRLQIFEPFFSKEIIEIQQRRDGLILSADSVDINGIKHLKLVHPDKFSNLSQKQNEIYQFYDSEFRNGKLKKYINAKQYAFLTAVAINVGGDAHHFTGFNLHLYADPISGELLPFIREVAPVNGENNVEFNYKSLKSDFYKKYSLTRDEIENFTEFDYWVDYYSVYLNRLNIDETINKNRDLLFQYYFTNKYYPWSYAFKKRIRIPIHFNKIESNNPFYDKRKISFTGNKIFKDTSIIFSKKDSIIFSKETNMILKNSTIIFSGTIISASNYKKINITGDSLSTVLFTDANVNLHNLHFKGFGNKIKIKNRDVTAAITFSNSKLNLKNCTFEGGYSGDDLVNIFRSNFYFDEIHLSNAKSDGFDLDFSKGIIKNSSITNCGNDGIDAGNSNVRVVNTSISKCGDKAISIGEQSNIGVDNVNINNSEVGIGLKDGSLLTLIRILTKNNHIDLAAYGKKGVYGPSSIASIDSSFKKLLYLIEPNVILPKSLKVKYTPDIINYMYGKKYGKASIR